MAESKSAALPLGDAPKTPAAESCPRSGATIVRGAAHRNFCRPNVRSFAGRLPIAAREPRPARLLGGFNDAFASATPGRPRLFCLAQAARAAHARLGRR